MRRRYPHRHSPHKESRGLISEITTTATKDIEERERGKVSLNGIDWDIYMCAHHYFRLVAVLFIFSSIPTFVWPLAQHSTAQCEVDIEQTAKSDFPRERRVAGRI